MKCFGPGRCVWILVLVFALSGCSYQYLLEHKIYQEARKVRLASAQIDSLPEKEYNALVDELSRLEVESRKRGLEFAVQQLLAELFVAKGDKKRIDWLRSQVKDRYRKRLYQDVFVLSMRYGNYDLALWVLDEVEREFSQQESVRFSLPFLRCMAVVRTGNTDLCDEAIQFYTQKVNSNQAKDRFVGYQGLFFTYLARGDKEKAITYLEKMVFDSSLPARVISNALAQEIGLLARLGELKRLKTVLERFKQVYSSRMDDKMREYLDKMIENINMAINTQTQNENPRLSN